MKRSQERENSIEERSWANQIISLKEETETKWWKLIQLTYHNAWPEVTAMLVSGQQEDKQRQREKQRQVFHGPLRGLMGGLTSFLSVLGTHQMCFYHSPLLFCFLTQNAPSLPLSHPPHLPPFSVSATHLNVIHSERTFLTARSEIAPRFSLSHYSLLLFSRHHLLKLSFIYKSTTPPSRKQVPRLHRFASLLHADSPPPRRALGTVGPQ